MRPRRLVMEEADAGSVATGKMLQQPCFVGANQSLSL